MYILSIETFLENMVQPLIDGDGRISSKAHMKEWMLRISCYLLMNAQQGRGLELIPSTPSGGF